MTWTAGRILFALVRYLDWAHSTIMPEMVVDGNREDLVQLTPAGYATAYEIKISRSDWRTMKERWRFTNGPTEHLSRFFYVVPRELFAAGGAPAFVPEWVGILTIRASAHSKYGYDQIHEERPAHRFNAKKMPDQRAKIFEACYYRYWNQRLEADRRRFFEAPQARAALS